MRLKHVGVSLLLILGAAPVLAEPGSNRHAGRDTVRAFFLQNTSAERGEQRAEPAMQVQPDRRNREVSLPESSGYGAQNESASNSSADNGRRPQGRLTPEERAALRRQINEVGHDIYLPKR